MRFAGLILDFDGVLIDSESVSGAHLARYLSAAGHPITTEAAMARFMGLSGAAFIGAIEDWIGAPLPDDFHRARAAEDARVMAEGIAEIAGAVAFVRALPPALPRAIASSSSTRWIARHLDHLGLRDHFGAHLYSGREHVARGKPAPDLYLHAARAIAVPIGDCAIIEDSPVGATGAVASGGYVIGLCAGSHLRADHDAVLRERGVHAIAHDFGEVARLLGL